MLSTGDVQNYLRKLQTELRFIKFRDVDYKSLQTGNPCELLKIYHYIFLDFNPLFAKTLLDKCNCDFYGKTDSHFIDTMYKTLRDYFSYKPPITKEQFFTTGFAERKLQMACDVITLVRQECKTINMTQQSHQQQKRSGSASTRLTNGDKEKKRISSSTQQTHVPNTFHPLRDMGLEITNKKDHDVDEFAFTEQHHENRHLTIPKQQHIENWLDRSNENHLEYNEPITAMTISRLEEQIQILKVKVEDINARLENITSIIQETHPGNNFLSSSDVSNFNARLVIVENELAMLRRKTPQINNNNNENRLTIIESKQKQSFVPQGILVDSDEEDERDIMKSYAVEEPVQDFDAMERARSLLENAEQCNRDLLRTIKPKS